MRRQQQRGEWQSMKQFIKTSREVSAWFCLSSLMAATTFSSMKKGQALWAMVNDVTYNIAKPLLKDMFNEMELLRSDRQG